MLTALAGDGPVPSSASELTASLRVSMPVRVVAVSSGESASRYSSSTSDGTCTSPSSISVEVASGSLSALAVASLSAGCWLKDCSKSTSSALASAPSAELSISRRSCFDTSSSCLSNGPRRRNTSSVASTGSKSTALCVAASASLRPRPTLPNTMLALLPVLLLLPAPPLLLPPPSTSPIPSATALSMSIPVTASTSSIPNSASISSSSSIASRIIPLRTSATHGPWKKDIGGGLKAGNSPTRIRLATSITWRGGWEDGEEWAATTSAASVR
mmetsp:Transcript_13841/g.39781  ORF Transcript_13841/g.39781 Transcript_13841/m.39781 type:complete len:272 (+) Transcript_13841:1353-2168(+)